jgi:hypothetical protein
VAQGLAELLARLNNTAICWANRLDQPVVPSKISFTVMLLSALFKYILACDYVLTQDRSTQDRSLARLRNPHPFTFILCIRVCVCVRACVHVREPVCGDASKFYAKPIQIQFLLRVKLFPLRVFRDSGLRN